MGLMDQLKSPTPAQLDAERRAAAAAGVDSGDLDRAYAGGTPLSPSKQGRPQSPSSPGAAAPDASSVGSSLPAGKATTPVQGQAGALVPAARGGDSNPGVEAMTALLMGGDLSRVPPEQRLKYYDKVCSDLGLNPLTKPFDFIKLDGKLVMYAAKECTAQLSRIHRVSTEIRDLKFIPEMRILLCTVRASMPAGPLGEGRFTDEVGAVPFSDKVVADAAANAHMKVSTKAKRRAILSLCGLGALDESELDTLPRAERVSDVIPNRAEYPTPSQANPPNRPQSVQQKPQTIETEVNNVECVPPAISEKRPPVPVAAPVGDTAPAAAPVHGGISSAVATAGSVPRNPADDFRWEEKECRQRLIAEIKSRFPGIARPNLVQIAENYKHAGSWKVILRNLDDIAAAEAAKNS